MLVFTRRRGEYIVINGNIKVRVVGTVEGQMKLEIDAPREVQVDRGEIWEAKQADKDNRIGNKP